VKTDNRYAFFSLPTWLLTRALLPFLPKTHAWYGRRFTLAEWAQGQTAMCREFDYVFWAITGALCIVLAL
jgi:hypothetical protein